MADQRRDDEGLRECALFAGAGGGILGGFLLGWRTVVAVELEPYPASVLCARQNDGVFAPFPVWDDICTFDGRPWRGRVDVVSGGFPCQDISTAGKGAGITGAKSGLWSEMARVVREVEPRYVFVENSSALTSRGLGVVLGDLAAMGFDAEWGVLGAHHAGAPHYRRRIWIYARHPDRDREPAFSIDAEMAVEPSARACDAADPHRDKLRHEPGGQRRSRGPCPCQPTNDGDPGNAPDASTQHGTVPGQKTSELGWVGWWAAKPGIPGVAHGVANRVVRLRASGNGQVPAVARLAWRTLRR